MSKLHFLAAFNMMASFLNWLSRTWGGLLVHFVPGRFCVVAFLIELRLDYVAGNWFADHSFTHFSKIGLTPPPQALWVTPCNAQGSCWAKEVVQ